MYARDFLPLLVGAVVGTLLAVLACWGLSHVVAMPSSTLAYVVIGWAAALLGMAVAASVT